MPINTSLAVQAATDVGPQFVSNDHDMVGQDGAYSIPLANGSLWYFGDTFFGDRQPTDPMPHGLHVEDYEGIDRMVCNCGLISTDTDGRGGITDFRYVTDDEGAVRPLVKPLPNEPPAYRIWCLDGVAVGVTVYLFYLKVRVFEPTEGPFPLGFELIGSGVAEGSSGDFSFQRMTHDGSSMLWPKDPHAPAPDPHFASAALHDPDDEMVYVYGASRDDGSVDRCYLGRVADREVGVLEAYEYFSGDGSWSWSPSDAVALFEGMPNEMSVSYNEYMGCYLAVHSLGHTGQIVGRTAPAPWGPWSSPTILWTVEPAHASFPSDSVSYAGKEHPTLAIDGGKTIYLTYIEFLEYYPHLVEVTLR